MNKSQKIKAPTQMEAIKKAFASGLFLSGRNALDLTGTMNLVQRVADIRREGWIINSKMEQTKTMFGTPCQYNIYWLDKNLTPKEIWEPFCELPIVHSTPCGQTHLFS